MNKHTNDTVSHDENSPDLLVYRLREIFIAAASDDVDSRRWMAEFDRLIESRPLEALAFIAQVRAATEAGLRGEQAPRATVSASLTFARWLEDFEGHLRTMPPNLMTMFALILLSPVPRTTHEASL